MKITSNLPPNASKTIEKASSTKQSQGVEKVNDRAANRAKSSTASAVDISDDAKWMQKTSEVAHNAPSRNADRVAHLKGLVKEGKYNVKSSDLSDRIVEEHLGTDFGKNNL